LKVVFWLLREKEAAVGETLSVLFRVGRNPAMTKPAPEAIEAAVYSFLHEAFDASAIGKELGIPSDTSVRYEVQWSEDVPEDGEAIPLDLSIRGPQHLTAPLHDKLRAGFVEGSWASRGQNHQELAQSLGIPADQKVRFKLYVRSPSGDKFE
jgi:hypothetical protein